ERYLIKYGITKTEHISTLDDFSCRKITDENRLQWIQFRDEKLLPFMPNFDFNIKPGVRA
ncbi:MAG: hypothetical protein AAGG81_05530, partial [Chlamydiota bacterium]